MRERKYRAYHDEWGWVAASDILIFGDGAIRINHRDENGDIFNIYTEKIKELHLMDYTGLSDKNGKEVYESDIIKNNFDDKIGEIKWHGNGFWIVENDMRSLPIKEWREVIGNKHDNPELLKNENIITT